jgi:uncharacterized protein (TIGR01244 family)
MFEFLKPKANAMNIKTIDADFAVTGQIRPDQLPAIAAAGYKSILCARPDQEEPGQPAFADIARAAKEQGIKIVHIPVSGAPGQSQFLKFAEAWAELPKPMLGYCRSGARAGGLYQSLRR